jgi:hypothetical protein
MSKPLNSSMDIRRPRAAPVEYAGEWVAWNRERSRVIAHGRYVAAVRAAAVAAGHADAVLQKVRRPDTLFIGAT